MISEHSPPVSIPRLRTSRLLLREYRVADFDAFAANLADPEATKFIDMADRKAAFRIFGCQMGLWVLHGAGWWMVELDGAPIGNVGAFYREGFRDLEIGWNIHRAHWGKGYGSEAAAEAIRYAREDRHETHVTAFIDARNAASVRVAEHCGMTHDRDVELWGKLVGRWTTV